MDVTPPRTSYEHFIWNNKRWAGFEHRPDDILICTAYKAGTTWTQRIASLLIFQSPELEKPLTTYSPWMEINGQPDRQDLYDIHAKTAKSMGIKIAANTDAHTKSQFDYMSTAVTVARRGWLTKDDILNTKTYKELLKYLK